MDRCPPPGQPLARFIGELCGAGGGVALLLLAGLAHTPAPRLERAFGRLDRFALWHRRAAVARSSFADLERRLRELGCRPLQTSFGQGLEDIALVGLLVLGLWARTPGLRAARWPDVIRRVARASYERWLTAHRPAALFVMAAVVRAVIVDPVLHRSTALRVTFQLIGGLVIIGYNYRALLARYFVAIYGYTWPRSGG